LLAFPPLLGNHRGEKKGKKNGKKGLPLSMLPYSGERERGEGKKGSFPPRCTMSMRSASASAGCSGEEKKKRPTKQPFHAILRYSLPERGGGNERGNSSAPTGVNRRDHVGRGRGVFSPNEPGKEREREEEKKTAVRAAHRICRRRKGSAIIPFSFSYGEEEKSPRWHDPEAPIFSLQTRKEWPVFLPR